MPEKNDVQWSQSAEKDLEEIVTYIATDNIDVALEIFYKIKVASDALYNNPKQGRIVPELLSQNIYTYREIILSPWRIIYKTEGKTVHVFAVMDGRRNLEDILLHKLLYRS